MSNSMQNDYFSFMSERRERAQSGRQPSPAAHPRPNPVKSGDTIDFVQETAGIEVVEGIASDTLIQRVRNRWGSGER